MKVNASRRKAIWFWIKKRNGGLCFCVPLSREGKLFQSACKFVLIFTVLHNCNITEPQNYKSCKISCDEAWIKHDGQEQLAIIVIALYEDGVNIACTCLVTHFIINYLVDPFFSLNYIALPRCHHGCLCLWPLSFQSACFFPTSHCTVCIPCSPVGSPQITGCWVRLED